MAIGNFGMLDSMASSTPTLVHRRMSSTTASGPKICLMSSGSRGDVQPFIALAQGLKDAGFDITVVTHESYRPFVTGAGLDFRTLGGDPRHVLNTPAGQELMESGDNIRVFFQKMVKLAEPLVVEVAQGALTAVADADLVLCSSSMYFVGEALGEKLSCPVVFLSLQPMAPSREQPGVFQTPLSPRFKFLERWGYFKAAAVVGLQFYARVYRPICNRVRSEVMQIRPRSRWFRPQIFENGPLFLYGYSPHVVPRPSDWSATQQVCGYWIMQPQTDWQPSPDLEQFLGEGPPPVYIGFGSMPFDDPAQMQALLIEALERTGQRAVISQGWGSLGAAGWPDSVHLVGDVPHEWLFRRVTAVVHHGGAGTTAAGLRAGAPTIVVPHIADQPYWGRRVQALGCGPAPIPRKQLTPSLLAAAIRQATQDSVMRSAAGQLGERLRAEEGVSVAVDHLTRALARLPQK